MLYEYELGRDPGCCSGPKSVGQTARGGKKEIIVKIVSGNSQELRHSLYEYMVLVFVCMYICTYFVHGGGRLMKSRVWTSSGARSNDARQGRRGNLAWASWPASKNAHLTPPLFVTECPPVICHPLRLRGAANSDSHSNQTSSRLATKNASRNRLFGARVGCSSCRE